MRTGKHQGCASHDVANVDRSRCDVHSLPKTIRELTQTGIMLGYIAGVALHAISESTSYGCQPQGKYTYEYNEESISENGTLPLHNSSATNIQVTVVTNTADLLATNCVSQLVHRVSLEDCLGSWLNPNR